MIRASVLAGALLLFAPSVAQAAPPPNDLRTTPQQLTLPASVAGTTRESTLEPDEPGSCAPLRGSVFYEFTAQSADRIVVRLQAAGDLDAVVDVFRRIRSQFSQVACEVGDQQGRAELTFRPERGAIYVVRVGQRTNSVAGDFRLDVFAPEPPPRPPGPALPRDGVTRALDAVQDTSDAWSATLRTGTTYRINLAVASGRCLSLSLYAPGTRDFEDAEAVRRLGCGGYMLFTPAAGEGGRYALLVQAQPRQRGEQRYHLQLARAGSDDTAPGLLLGNYQPRRGALRGTEIDAIDLYRFAVARRSDLKLNLRGGPFALQLLDDAGRRLASEDAGELIRRISAGRYFVAVRARGDQAGRYTLVRASRIITQTSITMNDQSSARMRPGETVRIGVRVRPSASGPVRVTIERFDPLAGWQFYRQVRLRANGGTAAYPFTPPFQGRWRATAQFLGTRSAAPSDAGHARVLVAPPLDE
jgi:hypothetical protein